MVAVVVCAGINSLLFGYTMLAGCSIIRDLKPGINAGLVIGIASFLYFPAIGFSILIFFALVTLRPFHLSEWLVGILGIVTPYYFLFAFLFLGNTSNPLTYLPSVSVSFPKFQQDIWAWGAIVLLIVPFLISGFYIQGNILRMLIQVRKSWSLMLFYLLITLLIPFVNFASTFEYWILCALPFAAFHGYTFFYAEKKWLPVALHWLFVAFALGLNIWISITVIMIISENSISALLNTLYYLLFD